MLKLQDISKVYLKSGKLSPNTGVLTNFSASFSDARTCVVGPNGSGKSTLLLIIAGLLQANTGNVIWHNQTVLANKRKELFAIACDSIVIPEFLTARQVLTLTQSLWRLPWPNELIEQFYFEQHVDKTIDTLSAGNLKKLQLINAIMRKPQVLLLDEPNIALDSKSVIALWKIVDEYHGVIIAASNEPDLFKSKGFNMLGLHNSPQSNAQTNNTNSVNE